jgi:mRNA interferase MazF
MALVFHPERGTILLCDFSGFYEPEMVKRRPVVVLSPQWKNRPGLCTVVALSTTEPYPIFPYHDKFLIDPPLPIPYHSPIQWIKGDMVYSLSLNRLTFPRYKDKEMNRLYDMRIVSPDVMRLIENCVLAGICINR